MTSKPCLPLLIRVRALKVEEVGMWWRGVGGCGHSKATQLEWPVLPITATPPLPFGFSSSLLPCSFPLSTVLASLPLGWERHIPSTGPHSASAHTTRESRSSCSLPGGPNTSPLGQLFFLPCVPPGRWPTRHCLSLGPLQSTRICSIWQDELHLGNRHYCGSAKQGTQFSALAIKE